MRSLAETQSLLRRAITSGNSDSLALLLVAPADPQERLEIYRRHYRESFRRHLRGRYPTVEWLVGTDRMTELADALLHEAPPRAPSLAEFGEGLIDIVARCGKLPAWLVDVARLDWQLGRLSVGIVEAPIAIATFRKSEPQQLVEASFGLQPSLTYMQSEWPVDDLIHMRLSGSAPDRLKFEPGAVCLELRGGRGRFALKRLAPGDYAFRRSLGEGQHLSMAAERALSADPDFALSAALARLFSDGLVTMLIKPDRDTK